MSRFWILYYLSLGAILVLISYLGQYVYVHGFAGNTNYLLVTLGFVVIIAAAVVAIYFRYRAVLGDESSKISAQYDVDRQTKK